MQDDRGKPHILNYTFLMSQISQQKKVWCRALQIWQPSRGGGNFPRNSHHPPKKNLKQRFDRRNYTCGCLKEGKKVNRKRRHDRFQENQTTPQWKKFTTPVRQSISNTVQHRFPKIQPLSISTNRQTQIQKKIYYIYRMSYLLYYWFILKTCRFLPTLPPLYGNQKRHANHYLCLCIH